MTTPTNENRDTDRTEATDSTAPEGRHRLDLSVTKIAASACAAALAAAVGSQLGVAGTIAGAAVASAVATSAGALIGHSLERGKTVARKAMPALDPEQLETAILSRARGARAERAARVEAHPRIDEPAALTRVDETLLIRPLTDRAVADHGLDETVVLDRGTYGATNGAMYGAIGPSAQTVPLPRITTDDPPRTWKDRLPGRKPLIAAAVASFLIGTGAVTALEVARKGEFPGYHSNVFTNDPGRSGGSNNQPAPENPGGNGTHEDTTPSQKPDSPPSSSGSGGQTPSTTPSTPSTSGSTPSAPSTPSTTPSTGPTGSSTAPTTPPTSNPNPTTAPSSSGAATPSQSATGLGKATPSGGPTG
ncbi:hypothetical protein ABH920_007220 [Catenulispora sp. EB89]|uniref:hypothetical protein n=1 Tax=Catenulispora sp. EB89 TaxID=3156257 RepID=UPI00351727EE